MILDRNGDVLVGNRPSYDLYILPEEVQDRAQLLGSLDRLIGLDLKVVEQELTEAVRKRPFKPFCVKRDMSRDKLAVIETHRFNLPGVVIKVEPQRHYVCGKLAFHLLGHVGEIGEGQLKSGQYSDNKPGDLIGKSGVESKWQPFLNGMRGGEQMEVDAAGRIIQLISRKHPIPGTTVCLTIDKNLQTTAEKALTGNKGAIVAINPNNGEILALASSPSVDPNLFVGGIDKTTWKKIAFSKDFPLQNRALSGQYPPASVFKIIVTLAGLKEGIIDPEEKVACKGYYFLGRHRYDCWKRYGHGKMNLHTALVESCDVYFYQMGKRLGVDKIGRYARRFGLGKTTGFDVGQEKKGLIPTRRWKLKKFGEPWQEGETVSMSIGQSFLLVTPIQMATLIASIFNGGALYKPQVTRWVGKAEYKKVHEFAPILTGRPGIRREYLELVKKALVGVVHEPRGTGSLARLKHITVAGKTGTAQVVARKKGTDADNNEDEIPFQFRDHAWFAAVAPADSPEIALAIIIEHGGHGGSVAAPIAREMIEVYLGEPRVTNGAHLTAGFRPEDGSHYRDSQIVESRGTRGSTTSRGQY